MNDSLAADLQAAVIHDVKNQLAELALRLGGREDCMEETAIVISAAQRLTGLLLLYRQDACQLQANIDDASPSELLQELADEYRALFPSLSLELHAGGAPPFAFYDEALVRMALANALHNACRVAQSVVRLSAYAKDGYLVFEIGDDGPGFPEEMLGAPADSPLSASRRGTGLGLYLAGRIAGMHQADGRCGSVSLTNSNGARFLLQLP
jgi:signal transduction histidine kinase